MKGNYLATETIHGYLSADLLLLFIRVKFSLFFVDSFVDEQYVLFLHFSSLFPLSSLGPKQIKIVKMYYVTGCKKL